MKRTNGGTLEGVVPLFICDFYDIPQRGICKYRGEILFFAISRDPWPESNQPVEYAAFRLPQEQTEYFKEEKATFERLVGTYWSYTEDPPFQRIGGWSGRTDWQSFYDLPRRFLLKDELERETAELVGCFPWPSNSRPGH